MIPLEGKLIAGLDEFMLRPGHLSVILIATAKAGGSWRRIREEAAEILMRPIEVDDERNSSVAQYLFKKKLCREKGKECDDGPGRGRQYRYPDLIVSRDAKGIIKVESCKQGREKLEIWWQDNCLSAQKVRSKVGAITVRAKRGSKTGLSHINDWAQILELLTTGAELSARGKLIAGMLLRNGSHLVSFNPYILGGERITLAVAYLRADFDFFARFVPLFVERYNVIKKRDAKVIFAQVIRQIGKEAGKDSRLTASQRFHLIDQLRDLEKSSERSRRPIEKMSTTWHRISSRLETLVDIGLIDKGRGGEGEKYEYVYYPNDRLYECAEFLQVDGNSTDWIEQYLMRILFGKGDSDGLCIERLIDDVLEVSRLLNLPSRVLPIDILTEGIAWSEAENGRYLSLSTIREQLADLARNHPELARLARGRVGDRAEFLSLDYRNLEKFEATK